jgi:hypothetical protein
MGFINQLKTGGYHLAAMGKPREALENHRKTFGRCGKNHDLRRKMIYQRVLGGSSRL